MTGVPPKPKIYHITHVDNLQSIIRDGGLYSDAVMSRRKGPSQSVGMGSIKQRRFSLPVTCHVGDRVCDYVPFYFCPRSVMLYLIYRGNHRELSYKGGQGPILHLEVDLMSLVDWANTSSRRWAFTLSNAGANYAEFFSDMAALEHLNWKAIHSGDFTDPEVKEGKQAEFLVHGFVPWHLVERVGVLAHDVQRRVAKVIASSAASSRPVVEVLRQWYF